MNTIQSRKPVISKNQKLNTHKMKAVAITAYGSPDVLQIELTNIPIPKDNEILVKNFVSPVTTAGTMMRKGTPRFARLFLGLKRPKYRYIGTGFAGEIIAVGKEVKNYRVGDQVFGETIFGFSANAEFVCLPEDGVLTTIPANLTYEEVAPVCDGVLTSMSFLKDFAKIKSGQKVLINGASGSLGTAAVQLAKYFGAEVTGVCSAKNIELVKSLGADKVIDYTTTDFTKTGATYDIIYDTIGKSSFSECKKALIKNGKYLSPVLDLKLLFQMIKTSVFGTKKAIFSATGTRSVPDLKMLLEVIRELMKRGDVKMIIDKCYPLEQVVEAHRYVDSGRKKGNVVLRIKHG